MGYAFLYFKTLHNGISCSHLKLSIGRTNTLNIPIDASFTPNSKYVLTGSSDGCLNIYSVNRERGEDDKRVAEIFSNQREAITEAVYNPKYTMIATASSYVGFWLPAV